MDVPAVFASFVNGELTASAAWFRGAVPVAHGGTVGFQDAVSGIKGEQRMPVVVVDTDSLGSGRFSEGVLKSMRVRGSDIWLMTRIEDADDVFDAFNTTAEMVFAPYHTVRSDADLADILYVSDSVIPAVFVRGGAAIGRAGRPEDHRTVIRSLHDMGYQRVCVVDTDGSLPPDEWGWIGDRYPSAIPFVSTVGPHHRTFGTVISPCILP